MATYSKIPLSQSANGRTIMLSTSSAPYTLIHTSVSAPSMDEIWIYASNTTSADSITTFYWGGSSTSDIVAQVNIQAYAGLTLVIPGLILNNENTVYAFTQFPSAVDITGYVNRISA
jgi:hypothetical protein